MRKKNRRNGKYRVTKVKENVHKLPLFESLCKLTQRELKAELKKILEFDYGYSVIEGDGYLFAEGNEDTPVLLCAHLDTVHKELPKVINYKLNEKGHTVISSPQGIGGDDRCGVYMILKIISELKCSVLFLEDEEIGCVGASKVAKVCGSKEDTPIKAALTNTKIHYILEMDRKGNHDAVYYDLDNKNFENFITESSNGHFETNVGTCSDISYLAPALGVAAVNLSCGYYKEHHLDHYVVVEEMLESIEAIKGIIKTPTDKAFEWKEIEYSYRGLLSPVYGNSFYGDNEYYDSSFERFSLYEEEYEVFFEDDKGNIVSDVYTATSYMEALGMCMRNHRTLTYENVIDIDIAYNGAYEADIYMNDGYPIRAWERETWKEESEALFK